MSFTTQSASVPVVDANRCAARLPAITTSSVRGSVFHVSTSFRLSRKRWSSTSQRPQDEPPVKVGRIGRGRYGTGAAGSDTYESKAPDAASRGASNDKARSARVYSRRATARFGGHESNDRQRLVPLSKVVASASLSSPLSRSQCANQGARMVRR